MDKVAVRLLLDVGAEGGVEGLLWCARCGRLALVESRERDEELT